jgi:NitT/TauT family transport system substrate-binding protein
MVETMKAGRLDATFMIVPLAMKLREQGVPVKICYLGHRDGSTVMVRHNLPAKSLRDLRGKTFAIPSKYSNQNLVIHKLMEAQGVKSDEIRFIEMPPPDMPGALASLPSMPTLSASRTRRGQSWTAPVGFCIT